MPWSSEDVAGADPYRVRDFVPDFDAIAAEIAARGRATSARAGLRADVAYGAGARETLDLVFPPAPRAGAPLHVFVHGGYWRSGDKADYRGVAEPVLAAGGIAALVEYDLMPGTRLPVIVGQVRKAVAWLIAHAAEIGADPARVTASGHSAGGHLLSCVAATGPGEPPRPIPPLRHLLLVSGLYDLSGIPGSFLRDEAMMTPEEAAAYSPLGFRHHPGPDRTIVVGARETPPFHDQARALESLLRRDGQPATRVVVSEADHMRIVLELGDPDRPLGRHLSRIVANA